MKQVFALLVAVTNLLILLPGTASASELPSLLSLQSWEVPWRDTRPRDPAVDSRGNVWFCGQQGNFLAKLEPDSGRFKRVELSRHSNPHNLIIDDRDRIWYSGNQNGQIGRLDPITSNITRYPMPKRDAKDPHTLIQDGRGDIWFTVQWGNYIGRMNRLSGGIDLYEVPVKDARPYGIKLAKDGQPWIALLGSNRLATVIDRKVETVSLPHTETRPRRLEITPDGTIWYTDYARGYLGSYNPVESTFNEWPLPAKGARPYGMAQDDKGNLWIADTAALPNILYGFDTTEKAFFSQTTVEEGGSIRHMYFHPKSKEIWFGTDSGYVVRATESGPDA